MKLILFTLFGGLALAAFAGSDPRYDTNNYYSTQGRYSSANPAGLGAVPALDPDTIANRIGQQASLPSLPGETSGEYNIRKSRVPVDLVPELREEVAPSSDPTNLTGKIGWDEKLGDASRMATSGYNAAIATGATLIGPYISNATRMDGTSQAAARQIAEEMRNQFSTAGLFGELSTRYKRGARQVVRDYEPPNGNVSVTGDPGPQTGNGRPAPVGNSAGQKVSTEDALKNLSADQLKSLEGKGIDPAEFVAKIVSGNFSPDDLQKQLGAKTEFTAEETTAGKQIAMDALAQAGITPAGDGAGGAPAKTDSTFAKSREFAQGQTLTLRPNAVAVTERGTKKRVDAGVAKGKGGGNAPSRAQLLALMATLVKRKQEIMRQSAPVYDELRALGILPEVHGQNIFQIAHRNYRSFQKWRSDQRRLARVAQTSPPAGME